MKKIKRCKLFLSAMMVLVLLVVVVPSQAGNRSGTVGGQFLKINTSARSIAMGGAEVAIAEGVSSMTYNPAGMLTIGNYGFGAVYTAWFADIQHSFAGVVKNVPGLGAFGAGVVTLTTGDMIETTPAFPEGTGRTFQASDFAFNIAFARQVTDQFRVGVSAKLIKSYLFNDELGNSTFAFDIGTLYDVPQLQSHLGVSLTNIGKDQKYIDEQYSLPTALRFGVLVDVLKQEINQIVTTVQFSRFNDADERYNVGIEYVYNNIFALRGGLKFDFKDIDEDRPFDNPIFQENQDFSAGFGVKLNTIGLQGTLDYGYNHFKFLPSTHTFSFEIQL
ncbi:MAG: PorV/PorQ family protein [Ignavibacteriae bacterium]|nr:PorV/PorQ family protein [Ignavibacteriota bacterium]